MFHKIAQVIVTNTDIRVVGRHWEVSRMMGNTQRIFEWTMENILKNCGNNLRAFNISNKSQA